MIDTTLLSDAIGDALEEISDLYMMGAITSDHDEQIVEAYRAAEAALRTFVQAVRLEAGRPVTRDVPAPRLIQ